MATKTGTYLKRLAAGRNPNARSRSDEYVPHKEEDYDSWLEEESKPWYDREIPEVYVHLPSRRGKRPGKAKVVWFS